MCVCVHSCDYHHNRDYLYKILMKQTWQLKKAIAEMKSIYTLISIYILI